MSQNNFAMQIKGILIGAFSLLENIGKILLGLLVLMFQVRLFDDRTIMETKGKILNINIKDFDSIISISVKILAVILLIVGLIGVFCSVILLCGVKQKKPEKIRLWIAFQCASVIFLLFFVAIQLSEIIKKPADTLYFEFVSQIFMFTYTVVYIYFLISAVILFKSYQELSEQTDLIKSDNIL